MPRVQGGGTFGSSCGMSFARLSGCTLILVTFCSLHALASDPASDCNILLSAPWMAPDKSWIPGTDCCKANWTGITCISGSVSQISLFKMH